MGTGKDGGQKTGGVLGEQNKMAVRFGFLKGFEEGILSCVIHGVSGGNNEKPLARFMVIGMGDKVTDLFYGNGLGFFVFAGA